jgi:PKD repeat protein
MRRRIVLSIFTLISSSLIFAQENDHSLDQYIRYRFIKNGKEVVGIIVPGRPPDKHREPVAVPTRSAVLLNFVPAFNWSFGCSATSAAMAAGYYDNNGYSDMYSGPTNWGFMPMDNSSWGTVVINGETQSQCPLSATRNTVDGRTARGHVDDYWISNGSTAPDPFITNGWTEHTHGACTGDFMATNQSDDGNSDGSTTFYFWVDGSPYSETDANDGCYGLKLFYESRGYVVESYYTQLIYGYPGTTTGFTFNQYKQEIDNGRPVLIQVSGHTMLGFGYDNVGNTVYLHDTWDYISHTMTWGDSYSGMAQWGVTVVELASPPYAVVANFSANKKWTLINATVDFTDMTYGNPTGWSWSFNPGTVIFTGGTSASSKNPKIQFTAGGFYTVTLIASKTGTTDSETRINYIGAIDCAHFPFPVAEDFSEKQLPVCWSNIDHIGNGQVWQFIDSPPKWGINTATAYNGIAIVDSDTYGAGGSQNTDMVTPSLDLSAYSTVNLYFQHWFRQYSSSTGTLSYSINGGSTWTSLQTWTSDTENPAIYNQDVTSQVAGHAQVKFKWNYIGFYDYYWAVDDISITGTMPGLWTGTTSSNWTTASNWSTGVVPGSATNINLPYSAPNWPVRNGNLVLGTNCGSIYMNSGSQMTINGNLTIPTGKEFKITGYGLLKVHGAVVK